MTLTATLGDATVAELRSVVDGAVIVSGDAYYETARRTGTRQSIVIPR
jgi:hypothetical protein